MAAPMDMNQDGAQDFMQQPHEDIVAEDQMQQQPQEEHEMQGDVQPAVTSMAYGQPAPTYYTAGSHPSMIMGGYPTTIRYPASQFPAQFGGQLPTAAYGAPIQSFGGDYQPTVTRTIHAAPITRTVQAPMTQAAPVTRIQAPVAYQAPVQSMFAPIQHMPVQPYNAFPAPFAPHAQFAPQAQFGPTRFVGQPQFAAPQAFGQHFQQSL